MDRSADCILLDPELIPAGQAVIICLEEFSEQVDGDQIVGHPRSLGIAGHGIDGALKLLGVKVMGR